MGVGGRAEGRGDVTGTVSVLFTDLVGSTELRSRLGEAAAEESRRAHDALLADAVQRHGGSVVKGLGDGVMAVFSGAADAVAAGVAIQQAIDAHNRSLPVPLGVRVGISAGDVSWEGDDCFGVPVVEAARLCAAAGGGQVLVADLVRVLTRGRGDHTYVPVGALDLKGLPEPVVAAEVTWTPLPRSARAGLELPPALAEVGPFPFAGRAGDLDAVVALWDEAAPGHRRVALVGGEPGIGKTRLAAEAGRALHARGVPVLYGRCDDQLSVPFQPFVEALRFFVAHRDGTKLAKELGPGAGELVRLVPELAEHLPGVLPPLRADPETEAYALFEAVAAWLAAASAASGLVVVLDDLHWATKSTLLLLRHVARSPLAGPLLVVGTYRDTELGAGHPLAEVLRDLRRCSDVARRRLEGLDDAGVVAFVKASSGQPLTEDGRALADAISARTGGNPFLVGEVLRHLLDTAVLLRHGGGWSIEGEAAARIVAEELPEALGRDLSLAGGGPAVDTTPALPAGNEVPFPPALGGAVQSAFVGRVGVLKALQDQLMAVRRGKSRLVLVTGEPGIGKSCVTAEFASHAHASGATVLFGRCDEEPLRPYQPVAEAVETYLYSLDAPDLVARLGRGATELARLVPELEQRLAEGPAPVWSEPETERFRLFETVAELATELAQRHPLVAVIDDLHWADKGTLLLLRHVLRRPDTRGVLVVATCREVELASSDALADLLGELGRDHLVERIAVRGLDDAEVKAFLDTSASPKADADSTSLAKVLRSETEGNPFFLGEMVRYLDETGAIFQRQGRWVSSGRLDQLGVPDQVRSVITSRVGRLSEEANRTLTIAAVIGREFHFDILQALVDLDEDQLLQAIEEAEAAGVLREVPGAVDTYTYSHAIVRDTLYDALSGARRRRLHRRIGELLESVHVRDATDGIGELAYHWVAGAKPGEGAKAARYARMAGERALAVLAPDEAIRWFLQARDLLDADSSADAPERLDVLIGLGDAQRQVGEASHRETLLAVASEAAVLGDTDRLVAAVLTNQRGIGRTTGEVDHERVRMLELALESFGKGDSRTRAWLLATLAYELCHGDYGRRRALVFEAESIARRLGDDEALVRVLNQTFQALWVPENLDRNIAASAEALRLGDSCGDLVTRFWAAHNRLLSAASGADRASIDAAIERTSTLAREIGQPYQLWLTELSRCWIVLLGGDADEAERIASDAVQMGSDSGQPAAVLAYGASLVSIRWHQGRQEETLPVLEQASADNPSLPALQAAYAEALSESGHFEGAKALLETARAAGFHRDAYDYNWLTNTCLWADVAAWVGDTSSGAVLYEQLVPFEAQGVTTGATHLGTVGMYLARLAESMDRNSDALRLFERADAQLRSLRAPFFQARNQVEWAASLSTCCADGAIPRAGELLADARTTAVRYGCAGLERRIREVADAISTV